MVFDLENFMIWAMIALAILALTLFIGVIYVSNV